MENKRLLFDVNNEQKSLTNKEESARTRSYLGESARVGALYALTSTVMKKTGILSSKSRQGRSGIALAAAIGIGMVTAGENNRLATLGGAMLLTGGAAGFKTAVKHHGDKMVGGIRAIDNTFESINRNITEAFQKSREFAREDKGIIGQTPLYKEFAGLFGLAKSGRLFDGSNSKAFEYWQANKSQLMTLAKEDKNYELSGKNKKYLEKMITREDVGWSPFSELLRYTNRDGSTNISEIFKKGSDPGNVVSYLKSNKTEIEDYLQNTDGTDATNFDLQKFVNNKIATAGEGVNTKVDEEFLSYYDSMLSSQSEVTIGDLFGENRSEVIDTLTKKVLGSGDFDQEVVGQFFENVFKDLGVSNLSKTKTGNIFDNSLMDPSAWAIDIASAVENNLRPVFSFLPGSESASFSLIPIDLKGLKRGRGKSNFQFVTSNENIKGNISNLQKLKDNLQKGGSEYEILMNKSKTKKSGEALINKALGNIDAKMNEFITKQKKYGDVKNNFVRNVDIESTSDDFIITDKGNIMTNSNEKLIGFQNQEGKLKVMTNNEGWKEFEGKFKLTYDKTYKENLFKMNNEYIADGFHDYGVTMESEHYYGDSVIGNFKSNTKKVIGKFGGLNPLAKFGTNKKNNKLELDNAVNNLNKVKNNLIKDIVEKSGSKIEVGKNETVEDIIRAKLETSNAKDFLKKIEYQSNDKTDQILNIFNLEKRTKSYYGANSFDDETIGGSVKRGFVSRLLKEGYGKDSDDMIDAIFEGNKDIDRGYFESIFVRQPIAASRGQFARVTGSGGVKEVMANLNFNSTYEEGFGTVSGAYINDFFGRMESTLNFLGIRKMDEVLEKLTGGNWKKFNVETANPVSSFLQLMGKRVAPIMLGIYAAKAIEGATDVMNPFAETGIGGLAVKGYAAARLGFQHILEKTGLQGAANYIVESGFGGFIEPLDLHLSTEEMKERYFEGKEIEVKRGRFWFGGNRTSFVGSDTKEFRQHWIYKMQNRDAGIYNSKEERFIREDFLVTKLLSRITNPYLEEQRLAEKGMQLDRSEKLFTEIPVVGELLAQTIGRVIKPFKYYGEQEEEINPFLSVVDRAFEDLKTWGGYSGYSLTTASNFLFGASGVADFAAQHLGAETRELASIDAITAAHNQFYGLEMGGMFGITEPIRRILTTGRERINTTQASTGVEWYDRAINSSYTDNVLTALQSSTKQLNENDSFLEQQLKVLGNVGAASTAYHVVEAEANRVMKVSSPDEARRLQGLVALGRAVRSKDTTIESKFKSGIKISESFSMSADQVLKPGDFYSDGKRYKLAGIETDFNKLSQRMGSTKANKELSRLTKFLESKSFSAVKNVDDLSAVKIDDSGEYFEIFSKDIQKEFKSISTDTALDTTKGIFGKGKSIIANMFRNINSVGSGILNKSVTGRSAYNQFVNETQINPSFRSWEDPVGSFISPMINSKGIGYRRNLKQAGNMSKTGDNFLLKGLIMGGSQINRNAVPAHYAKTDIIQMKLENAKSNSGENSIYNLNQNSSYSQIKKSLTYDEKNLFQSLMNSDTANERQKIYEAGSSRFRRVMDVVAAKKIQFATGKQVKLKRLQSPAQSDFTLTGNIFEDMVRAKRESGFRLQSSERATLYNAKLDQNYFNNMTPQEIRNQRATGNNTQVTSNIFGGSRGSFIY